MKGGNLIYKCRNCNWLEDSIHVPDLVGALYYLKTNMPLPKEWYGGSVNMYDVHRCKNGELGICDLIGGHEDETL